MAELRAAAALADDDRVFREAIVDALKELVIATQQMREQNAAYQAKADTRDEETRRRLTALEARGQQQAERAEQRAVDRLKQRVETDWKIMLAIASLAGNFLQLFAGHVVWHW